MAKRGFGASLGHRTHSKYRSRLANGFRLPDRCLAELASDDAPAKVVALGYQRRGEARPGIVLFLGKLIDFPRHVLRDSERDIGVVAPLITSLWAAGVEA